MCIDRHNRLHSFTKDTINYVKGIIFLIITYAKLKKQTRVSIKQLGLQGATVCRVSMAIELEVSAGKIILAHKYCISCFWFVLLLTLATEKRYVSQ